MVKSISVNLFASQITISLAKCNINDINFFISTLLSLILKIYAIRIRQ